ncbi:MAG: phosphatase PAP2 family protein [Bacteroidetes bacterium]|nr:phosphatase PAP2 family protein [Bacteroidota bacterium]
MEFILNLDRELFFFLNGLNNSFFDVVMSSISGRLTWIPLYAFLLYLLIRKYKWKTIWIVLAIILLTFLADQTANLFKASFQRLRPCQDDEINHMVHFLSCGGRYGFISGHAANTFALATFVAFLFKDRSFLYLRIIFFSYAALNAYSRIYLGVHYPGDVIAGALVGSMLGMGMYFLLNRLKLVRNS